MKINNIHEKALNKFVESILNKFSNRVLSIILFGSLASGRASKYSDVDILTIMNDLPEFKQRYKLISDIDKEILLENHVAISSIILTPEEVKYCMKNMFPLFSGMVLGYKVIYDADDYTTKLKNFESKLKKEGKFKDGVWDIPKIAIEK
jgi:hypothetical protein